MPSRRAKFNAAGVIISTTLGRTCPQNVVSLCTTFILFVLIAVRPSTVQTCCLLHGVLASSRATLFSPLVHWMSWHTIGPLFLLFEVSCNNQHTGCKAFAQLASNRATIVQSALYQPLSSLTSKGHFGRLQQQCRISSKSFFFLQNDRD